MSEYPPEQQESEYLHTALLEYQRDVESLTVELTLARARIAELEACIGECDRHAIKILQIKWGNDGDCGAVQYADAITDATETVLAKLPATPPPVPGEKGVGS